MISKKGLKIKPPELPACMLIQEQPLSLLCLACNQILLFQIWISLSLQAEEQGWPSVHHMRLFKMRRISSQGLPWQQSSQKLRE